MTAIEERAKKYCVDNYDLPPSKTTHAAMGYIQGATEQRQIDIEKAVDVYTNELRQTIDLLNKVGEMYDIDKLGEILSFEGCVKDFRKTMKEES